MIIYVVFVCEEILTVHLILTFFHYVYSTVLMLISTAILKIRVKSLYDFRSLYHLFQQPRISSRATQQHATGCMRPGVAPACFRVTLAFVEFLRSRRLDSGGFFILDTVSPSATSHLCCGNLSSSLPLPQGLPELVHGVK